MSSCVWNANWGILRGEAETRRRREGGQSIKKEPAEALKSLLHQLKSLIRNPYFKMAYFPTVDHSISPRNVESHD